MRNSMMLKQKVSSHIIWFLPIIFAIHNIEEILFINKSVDMINSIPLLSNLYQRSTYTLAIILLTLLVTIIMLFEYQKHTKVTFHISLFCFCLLLVNGFSHVIQFIVFQQYIPGLVSAIILFIPYIIYYLYVLIRTGRLTKGMLISYMVISMITMGPIIFLFLFISKGLLHYIIF